MPMFVALLPLILGILLFDYVTLPLWLSASSMFLSIVMAYLTIERREVWLYASLAVAMFGYVVSQLHDAEVDMPLSKPIEMTVDVVGEPAERAGYRVADGRVVSWRDEGVSHDAEYAVQLWIRSDTVCHGDRLSLFAELNPRISRHAGYDRLMHRRGYVGGVGINDFNILALERHRPTKLQSRAVAKIGRLATKADVEGDALATVEAMVAGSRTNMSQELRDAYSRTGLAHLMAVSGLHLGIVVMVIGAMLLPLLLIHRGHVMRNMLIIVALWIFVAVGGASPSLVRAAIMFTVLQLALAGSRSYNPLNTLSVTIFAMLVYRPNYLYDVSFQLSVMAVMGIVAWALPMIRRMRATTIIERWVYSTAIIGIVATLWTMPIVSHTFGNIALIGVGVTPILLFTSYIIVACGVLVLLLPEVVGYPFALGAGWAAELQNDITMRAASYQWASIDYSLPGWGVAVCYMLYFAISVAIWSYGDNSPLMLNKNDDYE